ncbi:Rv1733c family protein [Streptomyces coeruleofuscus]|uniref:Integral membrane protein n=1 Tax=Streptomyces coeruleofuscus TaxID=66879 RepID=A0ABN3J6D4_9ACTN
MRTRVRGWRWRRSPLRRRSDVVEAWTVLVVAVLILVGAPVVGAAAAWWAHGEARSVSAEQQAERHRVRAEVVGRKDESLPSVQAGGQHAYRATVRWTEPGEGTRTTTARVPGDTRPGEVVDVWFDSRGRSVTPPVDGTGVWQHTLTMGTCAAVGEVLVVLLAHSAVRRVALRRRLAEWEREWARTEPEWTRRDA